jgi:putative ABC transport system permease protein
MILGILDQAYVIDHGDSMEGWFLMPEQAALKLVSYHSLNSGLLVSTEADKEAAIGETLEQLIGAQPELDLETLADKRISCAQTVSQMFGAISGLAIFIMMFSILSMMNTLITNIVTRKQELAMLESIGMSKGQIRRMILGESMILVIVTVGVTMTIGTICGYILSRVLYDIGAFYMAFQFPTILGLAYGIVLIIVPFVITLISMNSFSKEGLVERLRGTEN